MLKRKNRVRRSSAATLTSNLNSVKVEAVQDIRPGDIRLTHVDWSGKHIAIIVATSPKTITYAHSSETTKTQGPHFATIKILDKHKGLDAQQWSEVTQDNQAYGPFAFDPKRGDSVRRLRYLEKL